MWCGMEWILELVWVLVGGWGGSVGIGCFVVDVCYGRKWSGVEWSGGCGGSVWGWIGLLVMCVVYG